MTVINILEKAMSRRGSYSSGVVFPSAKKTSTELKSKRKNCKKTFKSFTVASLLASTLWIVPAEQAFALATNGNAVNALVSPLGIGRCSTRIGSELSLTRPNSAGANIELKNPGNNTIGQLLLRRTTRSNDPNATVLSVSRSRIDNSSTSNSVLTSSRSCGFADRNDPRHPSGITFRSNAPNVGDNWNAIGSFSLEANFTEGGLARYYYFAELSSPVVGGNTSQYQGEVRKELLNPRPTISGPAEYRRIGDTPVTITFDQAVSGFALGDIVVTGGTASGFAPSGTNEWTILVTPDGSGDPISVNVASRVADSVTLGVVDSLTSPNFAATPLQMTGSTDADAPIPTVSTDAGTPSTIIDGTPFTVEVTFNEDINDFAELTDVTVTNGTPTSIVPTGTPNTFTVTVVPNGNGDVSVSVPIAVAVDDGGNDNVVSNVLVIAFGGDELLTEEISDVLTEDLFETTRLLSQNASNISRRAADRLRLDRGQACGQRINELLQDTPVRFANDSFVIDAANNDMLDEITQILNECDTSSFSIDGHTDSDASDAYNVTLSLNRVRAVKAALVRRGISDGRLQTRGFGESRPIATNATEEGQALNRRVEFILLDASEEPIARSCTDGRPFGGDVNGNANDNGGRLSGLFGSEGYNCVTGELTETWGELNVVRDDNIGTQGMASFGMSKERQIDGVLSGRFVEGYVSRTEVDNGTVEGDITGVGVHGGLYGARATQGGLVMSYYGSAAVGRHAFELDAASGADGSYLYAGVFAGGALTGEQETGSVTLKPSVGLDLGYSKSFGEDISTTGTLEIEPATYARTFVELGVLRETGQGVAGAVSTLEFAPRAFCETTLASEADACGYGARLNYTGAKSTAGTQWDVEFDYETIGDRDQASFGVARAQDVMGGMGTSRSSLGMSTDGALQASQTVAFTW